MLKKHLFYLFADTNIYTCFTTSILNIFKICKIDYSFDLYQGIKLSICIFSLEILKQNIYYISILTLKCHYKVMTFPRIPDVFTDKKPNIRKYNRTNRFIGPDPCKNIYEPTFSWVRIYFQVKQTFN